MTDTERIAALEREVADLKARLAKYEIPQAVMDLIQPRRYDDQEIRAEWFRTRIGGLARR